MDQEVLTMGEAQIVREFPNLWEFICKEFEDFGFSEKRRVLALACNVCGSCHDAPSGCQCGNDE